MCRSGSVKTWILLYLPDPGGFFNAIDFIKVKIRVLLGFLRVFICYLISFPKLANLII